MQVLFPGFKVFLLALTLFSLTAWGEDVGVQCGKQAYRVAVWDSGGLYSFKTHTGFDRDFLAALSQRSGCKFVLLEQPFARLLNEVERGAVDIGTSVRASPERAKIGWFANYLASRMHVLIRADTGVVSLDGMLARDKLLVSAVRGTFTPGYEDLVETLRRRNRLDESNDVEAMIQKLKAGRVQAVLSFPLMYQSKLAELGMENQVHIFDWAPQDAKASAGLVFSKKVFSEADVVHWRKLLDAMRKDGSLLGIAKKHFSVEQSVDLLHVK